MEIRGKVVAETKVRDEKGMAVRATLDSGLYFEIVNIQNQVEFDLLCKIVCLGKKLTVQIDTA